MRYTARDSKIGSGCVGQPLNLTLPASLNLFKLSCFGSGKAWFKFRAPPCHFPILESLPVYLCFFLSLLLNLVAAESHHVLGIGASTIDLLIQVDDAFISQYVPGGKGGWRPCDAEMIDFVLQASQKIPKIVPGGSAANTIRALAKLGEHCSFFSHVGNDPFGENFCTNLTHLGIEERLIKSSRFCTSRVLCLVSSDGQRSFLGCDPKLPDLRASPEHFADIEWVHFEARGLDSGFGIEWAMSLAKEKHARISLDLSSPEIVTQYKVTLLRLLSQYIDVVFCNDAEIRALTNLSPREGCLWLQEMCPIAVVTLGSQGCLVGHQGQILHAAPFPATIVDTTGAGDFFAAGFLYGYLHHYPLELCARIGNRLGSAIIEVVGAELPEEKWSAIYAFLAGEAHQAI